MIRYLTRGTIAVALMLGLGWQPANISAAQASEGTACAVDHVSDGDTLDVQCGGQSYTLRLKCIDTAEKSQRPWGQRARSALIERLGGDRVWVVAHERDPYDRVVATIHDQQGRDINLAMVRAGAAAVYDRYCDRGAYEQAERRAREAGIGIWSEPGLHQRPWEYRHNQ